MVINTNSKILIQSFFMNFMKEILLKNLIEKIIDRKGVQIIDILLKKNIVKEEDILKKTKMPINEIRNIFYKLLSEGIVSFIKKKDKKKGWFIYYWSLDEERSLLKIKEELKKEIEELKKDLEIRKKERFYYCDTCKKEIKEEEALESEFICQECASPYRLLDNYQVIQEIQKKIQRKEKNLIDTEREITLLKEENKKKENKSKKKSVRKNKK